MANKTKLKRTVRQQLLREQQRRQSASTPSAPSQPKAHGLSRWHERPAAERQLLERVDKFSTLRNKLRLVSEFKEEWAGIPMPLDGERLIVEPSYPYAAIGDIGKKPDDDDDGGYRHRNTFHSTRHGTDVHVMEKDGRVTYGVTPARNHAAVLLRTLGCAEAWGIEQESKAVELLGTMLDHRRFKGYLLTGSLIERSKRSGLWYLFRRLRPTVVIAPTRNGADTKVLCALCLHPIAFYAGTWAGAMTPSDEIVAHLSLMRGDEPMLWRRANQHAPTSHLAGI